MAAAAAAAGAALEALARWGVFCLLDDLAAAGSHDSYSNPSRWRKSALVPWVSFDLQLTLMTWPTRLEQSLRVP